jgi:NHL repeat
MWDGAGASHFARPSGGEGEGFTMLNRFGSLATLLAAGAAFLFITTIGGLDARAQLPTPSLSNGPRLDFPAGLATDNRTVWVASSRNNTITAIDVVSHSISIVAGATFQQGSNDGTGPAARFNSPDGVARVGRNLYVSDTNNSDIRMINLDSGAVTTVAGVANLSGSEDGHGTSAHFNLPTDLATDGTAIYICDEGNNTVRRMNLADGTVTTIGGQAQQSGKKDGPAAKSLFNEPRGIAVDGNKVYVSDAGNNVIREIDLSNMTVSTLAGTGEQGDVNGDITKA